PLVMLHGIRLHSHCWSHFSRAYSGRHRILALDARGHGESEWGAPEDYRLNDFNEDLAAVMDGSGLREATLIGHSLGGRTAMLYAHLHPERVKRLVLVDIGPSLPDGPQVKDFSRMTETPPPKDFASHEEATEYLAAILHRAPREMIEESVRYGMRETEGGRFTWKYDPALGGPPLPGAGKPEWDLWEVAASIRCPTLLLYGEHSQVVTDEIAERMVREMPDCRAERIPEAGHALFTEQPEAFARSVGKFLADDAGESA
ncbi:MAG: alpha/beta hydrolase, partial [SAR324 cluster bacterium]|nr:alpha/beta hydrolase [SAR324 cluster bacterium]